MVQRKPKDLPLGFSQKDFGVFRPKRPREMMPIIGTGRSRLYNNSNDRGQFSDDRLQYVRNDVSGHIYIHDYEAERMREIERSERQREKIDMIVKLMFNFWIIQPAETISFLIKKITNRVNSSNTNISPIGAPHLLSSIFLITMAYSILGTLSKSYTYFIGDSYFFIFTLIAVTLFGAVIYTAYRLGL